MNKRNVLSPLKSWENLTLADNFIFCKVMETDLGICKELLEMLLGIKIERIEQSSMERTIKTGLDSKGILLDVYAENVLRPCKTFSAKKPKVSCSIAATSVWRTTGETDSDVNCTKLSPCKASQILSGTY